MTIPPSFKFSASSLQDYVDCPRRFELKYLLRVDWPAIENQPVLEREHFIREGNIFHHAVHQYLIGIPTEKIIPYLNGENLSSWWQNFILHSPHLWYEGKKMPEYRVVVPFGGYLFAGQFDLLIQTPDQDFVIFDWKTTTSKPNIPVIKKRIQSRLYPFLIALICHSNPNKGAYDLERIRLVYWFAERPENTASISYSNAQFDEDKSYFLALAEEINNLSADLFNKTADVKRCLYCRYRSLCERGITPGDWKMADETIDSDQEEWIEINFESIREIGY